MKVRKSNILSPPLLLNSLWPHEAIIANLQHEVYGLIGHEAQGALVLAEVNAPPKRLRTSGAFRPNLQTLRRANNSLAGVFLAYARPECGTVWIDRRLYLSPAWIRDPARRVKAGVPSAMPFKTKLELSLEMIRQAQANGLRFGFIVTSAYNQKSLRLHLMLAEKGLDYVAAVSKSHRVFTQEPNTPVTRNRHSPGRKSNRPQHDKPPVTVETFVKDHPSDWQRLRLREHGREEASADFAAWRVWPVTGKNQPASESWLIARRDHSDSRQLTYALCNAPQETSLPRLARMLCTSSWSKRALRHFESEADLAKFKRLGWLGWHHDMALTLLARLYVLECRLNKKSRLWRMNVQQARELIQSEIAE